MRLMKKIIFDFIPSWLRLWLPPLVGIPTLLLLGGWSETARFLLFTHHLFWIAGIILLINPIAETFWPSAAQEKKDRAKPQPSSKARARREARKLTEKQKPAFASETPAERLARLQKRKEVVDQEIEKLVPKGKERVK